MLKSSDVKLKQVTGNGSDKAGVMSIDYFKKMSTPSVSFEQRCQKELLLGDSLLGNLKKETRVLLLVWMSETFMPNILEMLQKTGKGKFRVTVAQKSRVTV